MFLQNSTEEEGDHSGKKFNDGSECEQLRQGECASIGERETEGERELRCSSIPQQTAEDCRCVCDCTAEEEEEEEAEGGHACRLCRAIEEHTAAVLVLAHTR